MGKNQYTFNIKENKEKWYEWCKLQKVKPLVEYKNAQQIFYFEFLEGKFKGLVGKTYWASINRGSNMRMSCLTSESKDKRSEEHTSELHSRFDIVCRLLLEKKKKITRR